MAVVYFDVFHYFSGSTTGRAYTVAFKKVFFGHKQAG